MIDHWLGKVFRQATYLKSTLHSVSYFEVTLNQREWLTLPLTQPNLMQLGIIVRLWSSEGGYSHTLENATDVGKWLNKERNKTFLLSGITQQLHRVQLKKGGLNIVIHLVRSFPCYLLAQLLIVTCTTVYLAGDSWKSDLVWVTTSQTLL